MTWPPPARQAAGGFGRWGGARRDPRPGETVYRLTNIVRPEQPDARFAVAPGYDVREGGLATGFRKLELLRRR